jgi:hypothetical protein
MASLPTAPPQDEVKEPEMNWGDDDDDDDDDDDYHMSGSLGNPAPRSAITSASSRYPETPSSQISHPSGLPFDTIASLTHDELRRNAEFMRYVALVGSLQELLSLRDKKLPSLPSPSPFPSSSESPAPSASIFSHQTCFVFPAPATASPSSSLRPSQSASQVSATKPLIAPLPRPRVTIRPAEYPPSILWTFEDYKKAPDIGGSATNKSRPPMRRVLRHEDGSILTESEWKVVRESAIIIARSRLYCLYSAASHATGLARKKKFFKGFFPDQWAAALVELERLVPLTSLCSGEWKADKTLGSVLQDEPAPVPSDSPPPSRSSTPSIIGSASRVGPASRVGFPSRGGPASSQVTSHSAPASSVSSSSNAARSRRLSPRRVALKSHRASGQVEPPPEPAPASRGKGKRGRDPSPTVPTKKRTKSDEDTMSSAPSAGMSIHSLINVADDLLGSRQLQPSSSPPDFLALVRSTAALEPGPSETPSTEPTASKTTHPTRETVPQSATPEDDVSTGPQDGVLAAALSSSEVGDVIFLLLVFTLFLGFE